MCCLTSQLPRAKPKTSRRHFSEPPIRLTPLPAVSANRVSHCFCKYFAPRLVISIILVCMLQDILCPSSCALAASAHRLSAKMLDFLSANTHKNLMACFILTVGMLADAKPCRLLGIVSRCGPFKGERMSSLSTFMRICTCRASNSANCGAKQ